MIHPLSIACIVEGHGDSEAVPILVRRVAERINPALSLRIARPWRVSRSGLVRPGEVERAVESTARQVGPLGGILILVDSEDDCPAQLGPQLLQRARKARSNLPISVVLAKREFEGWFLASAESLRNRRGLPHDLSPPPDPEAIGGAKAWLSRHMPPGTRYSETLDQPALAAVFDLDQAAARADSFEKCLREITWLIQTLISSQPKPP